jgi:hypothetical protein
MSKHTIAVLDTETGGLKPGYNPILSLGVIIAQSLNDEAAFAFALNVLPPDNTWLKVPAREQMFAPDYERKCVMAYNVHTGEMTEDIASLDRDPTNFIIESKAAEINAFVGTGPEYNFDYVRQWMYQALPAEEASSMVCKALAQVALGSSVTAIAHNARFDRAQVHSGFPQLFDALSPGWVCTQRWLEAYKTRKLGQKRHKGWSTLRALAEAAGATQTAPHEAQSDVWDCFRGCRWLAKVAPLAVDSFKQASLPVVGGFFVPLQDVVVLD